MRTVSSSWSTILAEQGHTTEIKLVINGVTYGMDTIYGATQSYTMFSGSVPTVGNCCASTLEFNIIPSVTIPRMASVILYVRLVSLDGETTSDWMVQGTYYIDTRSKNEDGQSMRFTAYDSMLKSDQLYLPLSSISTWPSSESTVVSEIASLMGVTVDSRNSLSGYSVEYPVDLTMREVLGYIAASHAGNWVITPENKLRLIPFVSKTSLLASDSSTAILMGDSFIVLSTGYNYGSTSSVADIQRNAQGFENLGLFDAYTGVKVWYGDNTYEDVNGEKTEVENAFTAGTTAGRVLEIDCPWGTQAMADSILTSIDGTVYQGARVERAEITPAAELGDGVICDGVGFMLGQLRVTYDGGFTPSISAPADEEVDHEYHYESHVQRELSRRVKLNESYYGFKTSRENGIEVVNIVDGVETTRMVLNSSTQAFYNADGNEALYFDAEEGIYRFVGDVTITSGSLNINNNFIVDVDGNVTSNGSVLLQGTDTKIIAPTILSDSFCVLPEDTTSEEISGLVTPSGFNIYARDNGTLYNLLRIYQYSEYTVFTSPSNGYANWNYDRTSFTGKVLYSGNTSGGTYDNTEIVPYQKIQNMIYEATGKWVN